MMVLISNISSRTPAVPNLPVVDPAVWSANDLDSDRSWIYPISKDHVHELVRTVARLKAADIDLISITPSLYKMSTLSPYLWQIKEEILEGRGIALIRGVPVQDFDRAEAAIAFWVIGQHIGVPVSQNAKGHLLGHVADLGGKTLENPSHRGYQTRESLPYHCDSCDIVSLLCLHPSKSGGESLVASSLSIYNEILNRAPELAAELSKPIYRDRRNEIPKGKDPWFLLPVFNFRDGFLSVSWQGGYILSAQRFPSLPRHSPKLIAAIKLFNKLAHELSYAMDFRRGDIQFLHNHVTVHSRTEFEDYPEIYRRRNLLRLWLSTPDGRPLSKSYFNRYGHLEKGSRPSGGVVVSNKKFSTPLFPE